MTAMAQQRMGPALTNEGGRDPLMTAMAGDAMHGSLQPSRAASETRPARSDLLRSPYRPTYGAALSRRDLVPLDQAAPGPGASRTGIARLLKSTPLLTEVSGCGVKQQTGCQT